MLKDGALINIYLDIISNCASVEVEFSKVNLTWFFLSLNLTKQSFFFNRIRTISVVFLPSQ